MLFSRVSLLKMWAVCFLEVHIMGKVSGSGRRFRGREGWRALVAAWQSSGLSQSEFCRRRGVALKAFGRWKRRYAGLDAGERKDGSGASSRFIEVRGASVPPGGSRAYRLGLPNGVTVEVGSGFDSGELSSLLSVAKSC
jgi:hypothetical protein